VKGGEWRMRGGFGICGAVSCCDWGNLCRGLVLVS